jgi:hypothetical protein
VAIKECLEVRIQALRISKFRAEQERLATQFTRPRMVAKFITDLSGSTWERACKHSGPGGVLS